MNLGELYVTLSLKSQGFGKQMTDVASTVKSMARQVESAGRKIGAVGAIITAALAGAVAAAAQHNSAVAAQVNAQKQILTQFAVEIGKALLPALKQLTGLLSSLLGWWQSLSPATHALIAKMLEFAAAGGLVAMAVGKIAGIISALAGIAGAVGTALSSGVLLPILGITAAVLAGVFAIGLLKQAWNGAFGPELQALVKGIGAAIKGIVVTTVTAIGTILMGVIHFIEFARDAFFGSVQAMLRVMMGIASMVPGGEKLAGMLGGGSKMLKEIQVMLSPDKVGFGTAAGKFTSVFKEGAGVIGDGIKAALKSLGIDLSGFGGGGKGVAGGGGKSQFDSDFADLMKEMKAQGKMAAMGSAPAGPGSHRIGGTSVARLYQQPDMVLGQHGMVGFAGGGGGAVATAAHGQTTAKVIESSRAEFMTQVAAIPGLIGNMVHDAVASAAPKFAAVLNGAMQGLQAGGPVGAIVGAIIAILAQSKAFLVIMKVLDAIIQVLADTFGKLIEPLEPLIGAVMMVVEAFANALGPIFKMLGSILKPITPFIVLLAVILKALAPVIALVAKIFLMLYSPFTFLVDKVLPPFFWLIIKVARVILAIVGTILDIWNGIIDAIDSVFNTIADLDILGVKPFGFLKDILGGLKAPTDDLKQAQKDLANMTWDSAQATAEATTASIASTDAVKKVSEALTNIPEGFKVAAATFDAMNPSGGGGAWTTPVSGPNSPGAVVGSAYENGDMYTTNYITVQGSIITEDELLSKLQKKQKRDKFRKSGSPE